MPIGFRLRQGDLRTPAGRAPPVAGWDRLP